jgi:beta-alanine degradation protein BauB
MQQTNNTKRLLNLSSKALLLTLLALPFNVSYADNHLPDPLEAGWQGQKVCEKLHDNKQHRILRCTFAPGVGHEKHYHSANFGYVIAGGKVRIESAKGTREVTLKTGASYDTAAIDWHQIVNIGDSTIIYLVIEPKQ